MSEIFQNISDIFFAAWGKAFPSFVPLSVKTLTSVKNSGAYIFPPCVRNVPCVRRQNISEMFFLLSVSSFMASMYICLVSLGVSGK